MPLAGAVFSTTRYLCTSEMGCGFRVSRFPFRVGGLDICDLVWFLAITFRHKIDAFLKPKTCNPKPETGNPKPSTPIHHVFRSGN
jgi:hypothetical protein